MVRNKKIYDSWNKIKPKDAVHERIITNIQYQAHYGQAAKAKKSYWRTFTPAAACVFMVMALAITIPFFMRSHGGEIPSITIPNVPGDNGHINGNDPQLPETGTPLLPGTDLSGTHIQPTPPLAGTNDPARPLTPLNPADVITLEEAVLDPYFGMYLPTYVPQGFVFDYAWRFDYPHGDSLIAFWQAGSNYSISWRISTPTDHDHEHIVSAGDRERFDLSLYTIPWMDSVPREIMQYVMNPMFLAEELTLEIVQARVVQGRPRNPGDAPSVEINFSVLFDGAVVSINATGASPEQVWEMFLSLG